MLKLTRSKSARVLSAIGVALLLAAFACPPGFACLAAARGGEDRIRADEIAGNVTSPRGPEAGVWVIAESDDFKTRFAKIVVTDQAGRYLLPELPAGRYRVWVRGYGLVDSPKVSGVRGRRLDLSAKVAPDAAAAAQSYPAAYWYAMMRIPDEGGTAELPGGRNGYLMWMKNMGCVGCHQLGNLATRTIPPSLGKVSSSQDAWLKRLQSGQAGG